LPRVAGWQCAALVCVPVAADDCEVITMLAGDRLLSSAAENVAMTTEAAVSEKLVKLGRRLGMNTDLRRSIFYAIITSDVRALI